MSEARRIRDELWSRGWELIEEWKAAGQRETVHLEFKRLVPAEDGEALSPNTLEALAKAISGFANTDGGVLVFGVGTDSKTPGLDEARELQEHQGDLKRELGQVVKRHHRMGEPLPRVEIELFRPVGESDRRGVIALYVPKSEAPVRVSAASGHKLQGRFYLRNEHGFGEVPYTMLAAMFGAKPAPRLRVLARFQSDPSASATRGVRAEIVVQNIGSGTAREVFVRLASTGKAFPRKPYLEWENVNGAPLHNEKAISHHLKRHLYPSDEAILGGFDPFRAPNLTGGAYAADALPVRDIKTDGPMVVPDDLPHEVVLGDAAPPSEDTP